MTIALGILAGNAVVIAADTEVGVSDYMKTRQGKVSLTAQYNSSGEQTAALSVSGSGNVQYLTHVRQEIAGTMHPNEDAAPVHEFYSRASDYLLKFHLDHIVPFASYGAGRPEVSLLVAYWKNGVKLWRSQNDLLTESTSYAAVGVGEMYATDILSQMYPSMWPLAPRTAVLLAAYVVHRVKDCIDGCGKGTEIAYVNPKRSKLFTQVQLKPLDDLFDVYRGIEAGALHCALGGERALTGKAYLRELRRFRSDVSKLPLFQQID